MTRALETRVPLNSAILLRYRGLERIKTAFRSSMTAQRLSGLTLLHVHRDLPIDIAAAVDEFSRRHPRRMRMVDILSASSDVYLSVNHHGMCAEMT